MSTTSSTSSASSIASFYTTNGVTRLNGSELISGLDTQSLITAMTLKTQSKIDRQGQLEQKATWRQQMYQEIQSLMVAFNGNYFSYAGGANNIMSSKFFDSGALVSSSSLVSATGASSAAGNVSIKDIMSLASAASLSTSYAPSATSIASGELRTEWTQSTLNGKSLTVTYGGNDYTLTLDSSASLDSADPTGKSNLQAVADALNHQIGASSSLNGKVQFSVSESGTGEYALQLSAIGSASSPVGIKANSADDTSAGFLSAIGFSSLPATGTGSLTGSPVQLDSSSVATSVLFNHKVSSSSNLVLSVDGTQYTMTLGSVDGKEIDLTGLSPSEAAEKIAIQFRNWINANPSLSGKVTVSDDTSGNISFVGNDGASVSVTGGSQNLLTGLGLANGDGTYNTSGTVDPTALSASYLGDALAGSTLSVQLNGVSKTITFKSTEEASYSSVAGLRSYLQTALNTAFGTDNVQVGPADDPTSSQLVFTTKDPTSILTISSSSVSNVLSENGALRISSGETNRLETTKTLNELKGELSTALTPDTDGKYSLSVNGKVFSFTGDTELGTVISTINSDPDAGVNIAYSQTLNRFTATADDTGSQGQVAIADANGGNFATALFGTVDAQSFNKGTDLVMDAYLGGSSDATTVTRSTNSFTLDDVNLNVTGTFNTDGTATAPITFSASSNVDDLYGKISDFVDAYNAIIDKVNTYVTQAPYGLGSSNGSTESYEPLTDAQKKEMTADEIKEWNEKAQQGLLQNDQTLSSILSDLRGAMERTVAASGLTLGQIGISTAAYDYTSGGKLVIDETTLKNALQTKSDQVSQLFTDTNGIAANVKSVLNNYVGEYGNSGALYDIAGSKSTAAGSGSQLDNQIADYEETIKNLKAQLTTEQNFWQTKFSTMESKLSVLNSQYNYLSSMLGGSQS